MLTFLLIGGLFLPRFSLYSALIVAVSRLVYTLAYKFLGANWRPIGALANIAVYLLGISALVVAVKQAITN